MFDKLLKAGSKASMDAIKTQIAQSTDELSADDRDTWIDRTTESISQAWQNKFIKGALIHNGDIGAVTIENLLNEMEQEALDQLAYVREIKRRLNIK